MKTTRRACMLIVAAVLCAAGQTQIDLKTQGRNIDFSGASLTKPVRTGTALPGTCSQGELFFNTSAAAGQNLYACTAANVWTLQSGANSVPSSSGQANRVLSNDGNTPQWRALGGDLGGAPEAAVVGGLQGRSVSATVPGDGQLLRWSAAASQWQPSTAPAGGANYSQSFTGQTTVTIAGSAHGMATANVLVMCYDNATPAARLNPVSVAVHPATYDITVTFGSSSTGRCVVNGSGGSFGAWTNANNTFATGTTQLFQGALVASSADRTAPAKTGTTLPGSCTAGDQFFKTNAGAGQNLYFCTSANVWTQMVGAQAVGSVFGRTGAVIAAPGDYSFSQISGTVASGQVAAGLDAAKIGTGAVNNTAFAYLANATSDLQGQLNGKAMVGHSHTAAGDVTGDLGSTVVRAVQGRPVSSVAPADGQSLVWNASGSTWQPGTVATGAGSASQLTDFAVTRSSATVLTIGANCSMGATCNARFGNTAYSFNRSCTATLTSGTGTAYIYVASGGVLTVGHNLSVSASSGCLAQSGVTNFPDDAIPLYTWTATSNSWDVSGGRDYRAILSTKTISAGPGILRQDSGGRSTVSVDGAVVPTYLTATATLDFGSLAPGACSADQTFALQQAVVGDSVAPGWPGSLEAGLAGMMRVSASNTIAVRLCNFSGSTLDPASASYRATIVRSF